MGDTVDANLRLGLPVDSRDYGEAAAVLDRLGVSRVRLLTNNPAKVAGPRGQGIAVCETVGLTTAGQTHNRGYLAAKQLRLGHRQPAGLPLAPARLPAADVTSSAPASTPSARSVPRGSPTASRCVRRRRSGPETTCSSPAI